jgi:hypothetical protein
MTLGPSGEICCGMAIPITGQPAAVAAEHPLSQPDSRLDSPATRTGLGGWKPPVTDDQFTPEPGCLVAELAGELGPSGVANSAGEMPVGHEVGDGEVFQAEPVVGLDELAGDAM